MKKLEKLNLDKLAFSEIEPTEENVTALFKDRQIVATETIDSPLVDGLTFWLTDLSTVRVVDVMISDELIAGDLARVKTALVILASEPIQI